MANWIFSTILPLMIVGIALWLQRPLDFQRIVKGLTKTLFPIFTYCLLMYYLESEDKINTSWVTYTVGMFYIPYLAIVLIMNFVAWSKRRKA